MSALRAESIRKEFPTRSGSLVVLGEVSMAFEPGEAVALMGPSGSGKSTLLNILGTLEPPSSGRVTLDGTDPYALSEKELARFRNGSVGFIFQEHHLLPQCSVLENALVPALPRGADAATRERAASLLSRVGLSDRLTHRPAELSGGERQRVAIARALVNKPSVVLADEPTGNLDRKNAEAVAELLLELQKDEGFILLVVTHSAELAARFPRKLVLSDGALKGMNGA